MNSKIFLTIGACLLFLVADALVLEKRDGLSVIAFPLQRVVGIPPPQTSRLSKRSFQSTLTDITGVFAVSISLGTPPKALMVQLDTGSSDLVVETDSSIYCSLERAICNLTGTCKHPLIRVRRKLTDEQMTPTAHLHTSTSIAS
jgi:hypothetical protein